MIPHDAAPHAEGSVLYFSRIVKKPVHVSGGRKALGRVADLVFDLKDPLPRAVGIHIDHGWNVPDEFVPWDRVVDMFEAGIVVKAPEGGDQYPPFEDQPGWILAGRHLMGRTILDIDDRKIEVVNDVVLQEAAGWRLAAVDTSFNGWFRKWKLGFMEGLVKEDLIPWKFVQPLSLEDAVSSDVLQLSLPREQLHDLPVEDLADALEELKGEEQTALFDALEPDKAAETLAEAEPRVQRQLIAPLRKERAASILASLSTAQVVGLMNVLPYEDVQEMLGLLPEARQAKVRALLEEDVATAVSLMGEGYLSMEPEVTVGRAKADILASGLDEHDVSYIYVTREGVLQGVVDARQLLITRDEVPLEELMTSPVVAAEAADPVEELQAIFAKYHFRRVPVVDDADRILGVVHHTDLMNVSSK